MDGNRKVLGEREREREREGFVAETGHLGPNFCSHSVSTACASAFFYVCFFV